MIFLYFWENCALDLFSLNIDSTDMWIRSSHRNGQIIGLCNIEHVVASAAAELQFGAAQTELAAPGSGAGVRAAADTIPVDRERGL
ncbi:unnamed protein product [Amoebophrya sp. A120]|nr:unnamed protein product [Amoebophrya sp. A120]|eukprot:GSA120T00020235001.1